MPRLSQLPVELHSEILKHASENLPSRMIESWKREKLLSIRSRFPYNAFMTCSLWRDLLARMPCWEFIAFNVASDPAPLLNAFEWSASVPTIDLVVFTSATEDSQITKDWESKRVKAIVDCLKPNIHRCKSIIFDVMYEESLPSSLIFFNNPAPRQSEKCKFLTLVFDHHLIELKLDFEVPKIIHRGCDYDLRVPDFPPLSGYHNMVRISMHGQGFMKLCLINKGKLMEKLANLNSLCITSFRFFDNDDDDDESNSISVHDFAHCVSKLRSLEVLRCKNLSVNYRPHVDHDRQASLPFRLTLPQLEFDDVSKDFQSEFFSYTRVLGIDFNRCSIPRICYSFTCRDLVLNDIIPDKKWNEKGVWESSLQRVLVAFPGTTLIIQSCSLFDDDLLNWLSTEVIYTPFTQLPPDSFNTDSIIYHTSTRRSPANTFPSENITYLDIYDCENYSFGTLRKLVEKRKEADPAGKINKMGIVEIHLIGKHPEFLPADIDWLLCRSESPTLVKPDGQVFEEIDVMVTFE